MTPTVCTAADSRETCQEFGKCVPYGMEEALPLSHPLLQRAQKALTLQQHTTQIRLKEELRMKHNALRVRPC